MDIWNCYCERVLEYILCSHYSILGILPGHRKGPTNDGVVMKRIMYGIVVEVSDDTDMFELKKQIGDGVRAVNPGSPEWELLEEFTDSGDEEFEILEELAKEVSEEFILI